MFDAAAAEALKNWDVRWALAEGWSLVRLGVRGNAQKMFENIYENVCNLVHFGHIRSSKVGRKIDAFPPHFKKWDGIHRPCRIGSAAPALM